MSDRHRGSTDAGSEYDLWPIPVAATVDFRARPPASSMSRRVTLDFIRASCSLCGSHSLEMNRLVNATILPVVASSDRTNGIGIAATVPPMHLEYD